MLYRLTLYIAKRERDSEKDDGRIEKAKGTKGIGVFSDCFWALGTTIPATRKREREREVCVLCVLHTPTAAGSQGLAQPVVVAAAADWTVDNVSWRSQ